MIHDLLKLTVHFGERDTDGRRFLADTLLEDWARRGLRASVLLRGAAGFGVKHHLRTDRLLTLSEDLPLLATAVDRPEPIRAAAADARERMGDGLLTLERASSTVLADAGEVRLTVQLGRGGRAHVALVALLHEHGVAGASVLLGVDGTAHGRRRRARFAGANRHVPELVVAVAAADRIAAVLPTLDARFGEPVRTIERVRVCKRDGARLAEPDPDPAMWQRLTVICGEQSRHDGRPLADALVRELRAAGAAGATALRGIWGFHGDHAPHGDTLWQLRRRVPVLVTAVDTAERSRRWFTLVDELTATDGLVLSERVPAYRATGPGVALGDLRLDGQ